MPKEKEFSRPTGVPNPGHWTAVRALAANRAPGSIAL